MDNLEEIKQHIERKAFAFGVSPVVSTLLGEYVEQLITQHYATRNKQQLVPGLARPNHGSI